MKLGVSTLFCLSKPLEEALEKIKHLGVHHVELTDDGSHVLTRHRIKFLREVKDSYGWRFSVHAPFSDVNIAAYDESLRRAVLRRLERSIEFAAVVESDVWIFHPGATTALEGFYPGKSWEVNLESVERLCKTAEEFGVDAAIENVPEPFPFLLKSVEDFKRFYSELGKELMMTLDIAHSNIRGETEKFLKQLGEKIVHIHVSDNMGDQDTHLQVGLGTVRWFEVMETIKRMGFRGMIIIESYRGIQNSLKLLKKLIS